MISFIIVNFNLKKELIDCISSIKKKVKDVNYEIIIVDNSDNNIFQAEKFIKDTKIKIIKSSFNLGYSKGNNYGAKFANGDYLFILNPDTQIIEGSIKNIINFIEKNKNVGAVSPQILDSKNLVYDEQGASILTPKNAFFVYSFINKLFKKNRFWKKYWGVPWDKDKIKKVDVVPGTAFLIKKDLFEKLGGFDPNLFLYFEEFDFCKKLKDKGFNNFISPDLKISHKWGASTIKNNKSINYFKKSRFYYFNKNFGLIKTILIETFLRINKSFLFLTFTLALALILRIYKLDTIMPFLGDTAWFFVSARNILINNDLPLVGITSSHVWLHQGAYWTYILALILKVFGFNPINAAVFTIFIDLITLIVLYKFSKTFINQKVAYISALFYAVSPFIVISSQIPYHTNMIPLFVILLLYSTIKFVKGNVKYFPLSILFLAVLYNFQISSIPLMFTFIAINLYGFYKKTDWFKKILNLRILIYSILSFIIPMSLMLIFDLNHGFSQTLKVLVWVFYKIAVFFGYPPINPALNDESKKLFLDFVLLHIGRMYFILNNYIAVILFILFLFIFLIGIYKSKFKEINLNIIFLYLLIPLISFLAMNSRSQAYLPMFFPTLIIIASYSLFIIYSRFKIFGSIFILFLILFNSYGAINYPRSYEGIYFRKEAARKIIKLSEGKPYNLIGIGPTSEFASFRDQFIYLTWYYGHPPSEKPEKLKFYVSDTSDNIVVEKVIEK